MKYYELTYLLSPELSESKIGEIQEKIISFIEEEGGKIEKSNKPIQIKLKYSVQEKEEGFLSTLSFYCLPEKLQNLEEKLKKESLVLRYLILNKKPLKKIKVPKIGKKIEVKKEKKVKLEEIDKKLEEILGQI